MTAALALTLPLGAQFVEENRVVTKRFPVSGAPEIVVSIVTGDIKVTAHSGQEVVMNAKVHYEAPDGGSLGDLMKRIRLESEQRGNNVWIGMESEDGNTSSSWNNRPREFGWRNRTEAQGGSREGGKRWRFRHDIELQVPRTAHLKLSTVNGGVIEVTGVAGEFSYNNVNGGIDVKNADGSGRAHTVNGPVSLTFVKSPAGPVSMKSVNGKMTLAMPRGSNAEFRIKTLNGRIYSDFAMMAGASATASESSDGMKRIWRSDRFSNLKVGSGGPAISIDGLNGEIQILEKKN